MILLYVAAHSQKTTIRFEAVNSSKNYSVDIGGRKFYSSTAHPSGTPGVKTIDINYLASGAHPLAVYAINNKAQASNNFSEPIYTNSLQLQPDHITVITIKNSGKVELTEKRIHQNAVASVDNQRNTSKQLLSMQQFESLFRAMKNQNTESGRYSILNEALDVGTNYFTIFQLTSLLTLINPESDRLTLAKKSTSHLLEEANAAALMDVFTMQRNKDELRTRIEGLKD